MPLSPQRLCCSAAVRLRVAHARVAVSRCVLAWSTHTRRLEKGGVAREAGPVGTDFAGSGTVVARWAAICRRHWELQLDSGLPIRCAVGTTPRLSRFCQSPAGGDGILWVSGTYH